MRYLEEDEVLLVDHEIEGISGALKDEAKLLHQQTPNTRLLLPNIPIAHLAQLHQIGKNGVLFINGYDKEKAIKKKERWIDKYDKKITETDKEEKVQKLRNKKAKKTDKLNRKINQGNQFMRWGEELAVYDVPKTVKTTDNLKQYMTTNGYLDASVTFDSLHNKRNKKLVSISYKINPGPHYYIDSIQYVIEDSALHQLLIKNLKKAPLKKGFYRQKILSDERDFIYKTATNNGYFNFSKQFISFKVDSVQLGKDTLIVREIIKNPEKRTKHKVYTIDSITFIANAGLDKQTIRTNETFNGITFSFAGNRYSKKILEWRIPLEEGERYSNELTIETQRQLLFLDMFKFVNINYDTSGGQFITNIFTSPFKTYQTTSEFGLTSTTTDAVGKPGPFFNINLKNRNSFRGMEIINLNLNASLEDLGQIAPGDSSSSRRSYSSTQLGAEVSITFPQFLVPKLTYYKKKTGSFNPKTRLSFGANYEDRDQEYERIRYQGTFQYLWQVKDKTRYTFTPIQIGIVDAELTSSFEEQLEASNNESFRRSFNSSAVNGSSFQLDKTLGQYSKGMDGGFISLYLEHGGHFNNIFGTRTFGDSLEYFQYLNTTIDLRKIEKVTRGVNIAYKLKVGYIHPYGPDKANLSVPYEKFYFIGGSNSIRAWKPRRLGPGSFAVYQDQSADQRLGSNDLNSQEYVAVNYGNERQGELIIESSFELRKDLAGFLEGAFFIDAGNIWLSKLQTVDPEDDGDGEFSDGKFRLDTFINEVAVGTGLGLRFDLSFLIFRLDMGIKMFDPGQPKGKRFVGDQLFSNFGPLTEFNIGIGYPF